MKKWPTILLAVAILPFPLSNTVDSIDAWAAAEDETRKFVLLIQQEIGNQSRNDRNDAEKAVLPGLSDPDPAVEVVQVVSDAGAEAVFRYSRNCFAPEDQEFECIYDPDPENPLETREDDPAQITPAEFNSIMHTEFAELHVTGSGLDFQPKSDGIIGLDFILATNPEPHIHHTQLFDIPITIRATPVHYLWNMGDGNTVSTTDPGKHHPDQTVTYMYEETGTYTVSLTTTWAGHFAIGDGTHPDAPWYPVAGTITTTETSEPITHKKYRTVLVPPDY